MNSIFSASYTSCWKLFSSCTCHWRSSTCPSSSRYVEEGAFCRSQGCRHSQSRWLCSHVNTNDVSRPYSVFWHPLVLAVRKCFMDNFHCLYCTNTFRCESLREHGLECLKTDVFSQDRMWVLSLVVFWAYMPVHVQCHAFNIVDNLEFMPCMQLLKPMCVWVYTYYSFSTYQVALSDLLCSIFHNMACIERQQIIEL